MVERKLSRSTSVLRKVTYRLLTTFLHRRCFQKLFLILWIIVLISGFIWYYLYIKSLIRRPSVREQWLLRTKEFIEELFDDKPLESDQYCQIMRPHPLDPATLLQISRPEPVRCVWHQPPLTFIDKDGILLFNKSAFRQFGYSPRYMNCYYRTIQRSSNKKNGTLYGTIKRATGNETFLGDFVDVSCMTSSGLNVYRNVHAYPQRLPISLFPRRSSSRMLSILVFSLDSLSRLTMMQQLPRTYHFLTRIMKAEILHGMTKVSDGVWANISPMMTGKVVPRLKQNLNNGNKRNIYPAIWRNYSAEGYVTLIAEDVPSKSICLGAPEFKEQPTDHFLHPYWIALEQTQMYDESSSSCYGHTPLHQLHLNYVRNFAINYAPTPYFAFSHITGRRHRCMNCLSTVDDDLHRFFEDLFLDDFLDNTIMFLTGNHGVRLQNYTATTAGRIESNTPICAVYLPQRVRNQFPEIATNLAVNSRRLTSAFDIHATLLDILNFASGKNKRLGLSREQELDPGYSLFSAIPKKRSCIEAGISLRYCVCGKDVPLPREDSNATAVADAIIETINRFVSTFPGKCALLRRKHIHSAVRIVDRDFKQTANASSDKNLLRVVVEAFPGGGIFEGVGHVAAAQNKITIETEVERINSYEGHGRCVTEKMHRFYDIKKYCYCNDFPQNQ